MMTTLPTPEEKTRVGVGARLLKGVVAIREDEFALCLWSALEMFGLLGANYVLRPLRDAMGVAGGASRLPSLFLGTLGAMLIVAALASAWAKRCGRPSHATVYRLIQLTLVAFFAAPRVLPTSMLPGYARAFLCLGERCKSSGCLDRLEGGERAVSRRTKSPFVRIHRGGRDSGSHRGISPDSRPCGENWPTESPSARSVVFRVEPVRWRSASRAQRFGHDFSTKRKPFVDSSSRNGCFAGVRKTLISPYFMGLALNVLLFTASSACVYVEQARIVERTMTDRADQTAFFAQIDLLVNLVGLVMQVVFTGRVIAGLGIGGANALLPILTLIGSVGLLVRPTVGVLLWFQVLRRAMDYAIARPCREVLYASARREDVVGAKGMIDTAVYRAGDVLGAWAFGLSATLPGSFAMLIVIGPLSLAWIILSMILGRQQKRREASCDP